MQVARGHFLAAAGFALDQHRVRGIGDLADLLAQQFDRLGSSDDALDVAMARIASTGHDLSFQAHLDFGDVAGLGDEVDRTVLLGLEDVLLVVLPRQHQHPRGWMHLRNLANNGQALVRAVRIRRQPEVDQRQRRRVVHAVNQFEAGDPVAGALDLVLLAQHELEAVGDDSVIVDEQKRRLLFTA